MRDTHCARYRKACHNTADIQAKQHTTLVVRTDPQKAKECFAAGANYIVQSWTDMKRHIIDVCADYASGTSTTVDNATINNNDNNNNSSINNNNTTININNNTTENSTSTPFQIPYNFPGMIVIPQFPFCTLISPAHQFNTVKGDLSVHKTMQNLCRVWTSLAPHQKQNTTLLILMISGTVHNAEHLLWHPIYY
jgi:hypothetical protein